MDFSGFLAPYRAKIEHHGCSYVCLVVSVRLTACLRFSFTPAFFVYMAQEEPRAPRAPGQGLGYPFDVEEEFIRQGTLGCDVDCPSPRTHPSASLCIIPGVDRQR